MQNVDEDASAKAVNSKLPDFDNFMYFPPKWIAFLSHTTQTNEVTAKFAN